MPSLTLPVLSVAWDGGAGVLCHNTGRSDIIIVAETNDAERITAICRSDSVTSVVLPLGCRVLTGYSAADPAALAAEVSVACEPGLLPVADEIDTPASDVVEVVDQPDGTLALRRAGETAPAGEARYRGVMLASNHAGALQRLRVGPLRDAVAPAPQVCIGASRVDGQLRLTFTETGGALASDHLVVAHLSNDAESAARRLALIDQGLRRDIETALDRWSADLGLGSRRDLTAASGAEIHRRGFALLAPTGDTLALSVSDGDTVLVLACEGLALSVDGAAGTGTRLAFDIAAEGIASLLTRDAYRPASATALAAIGGARALALASSSHGPVNADRQRLATDLAAAIFARKNARAGCVVLPGEAHSAGSASLVVQCGQALGLPPGLIEEIEAQPTIARLAFVALADRQPAVARALALGRVQLDGLPATPDWLELSRAASWLTAATTPSTLRSQRIALRQSDLALDTRRTQTALIDTLIGAIEQFWIDPGVLIEGFRLFASSGTSTANRLADLLANLRADATRLAEAQTSAAKEDLAAIARRRAELPSLVEGSPAMIDDLVRSITVLDTVDVFLLDQHFSAIKTEHAQLRRIRDTIDVMERAAGMPGLCAGYDRNADALLGLSKLALVAEPAVKALVRIERCHDPLKWLDQWLNEQVPVPAPTARAATLLRRNLQIVAVFLLYRAIADDLGRIVTEGTSPARLAHDRRLLGGMPETLPRLMTVAAGRLEGLSLGKNFLSRLQPASVEADA